GRRIPRLRRRRGARPRGRGPGVAGGSRWWASREDSGKAEGQRRGGGALVARGRGQGLSEGPIPIVRRAGAVKPTHQLGGGAAVDVVGGPDDAAGAGEEQ